MYGFLIGDEEPRVDGRSIVVDPLNKISLSVGHILAALDVSTVGFYEASLRSGTGERSHTWSRISLAGRSISNKRVEQGYRSQYSAKNVLPHTTVRVEVANQLNKVGSVGVPQLFDRIVRLQLAQCLDYTRTLNKRSLHWFTRGGGMV